MARLTAVFEAESRLFDPVNGYELLNPPSSQARETIKAWLKNLWDIRNKVVHGSDPLIASRKIAVEFRLLAGCVLIAVFERTNKCKNEINTLFKELDSSNQNTAGLFQLPNSFWRLVQDQFC
ncbi:MAG: hypothetical protein WC058_12745 [Phycisphaeraceae bacterium]